MKKRMISIMLAVITLLALSIPVSAATGEVMASVALASSSVGVSVAEGSGFFNYTLTLQSTGVVDDNSVSVSFAQSYSDVKYISGDKSGMSVGDQFLFAFDASTLTAGTYSLPFNVSFTSGGVSFTQSLTATLSVLKPAETNPGETTVQRVLIKNFVPPVDKVKPGDKADIAFDVINEGTVISAVTVSVQDSKGTELANRYVSSISGGTTENFAFNITVPESDKDTAELTIRLDYTLGGTSYYKTEKMNIALGEGETKPVENAKPLFIRNTEYPSKVVAEEQNTLTFNVINNGSASYTSCEASLYLGDALFGYAFVGNCEPGTAVPVTMTFTCRNAKTYDFDLILTYLDANNKSYTLKNKINVTCTTQTIAAETGTLKIQTINAPVYSVPESTNEVSFSVTNPTQNVVTGAEAYLYDKNENVLDSVYISQIDPNSSSPYSLKYVPMTAGTYTYTIRIYYLDSNKNKTTVSGSFTTEAKEDEAINPEEPKRPAELKVATINNPNRIYTNVGTQIPFAVVNAGKGAAYNVEVYVTDESGNEIARDYIGSIEASQKYEGQIKLKFTESASMELSLNFYWENFDETTGTVSKGFSQVVADYRASVGDLSGYDWLVEGEQATLSFAIQNLGTLEMLNTTANLVDQNGNVISNCFVGVVGANSKSENLRFKKVMFTKDITEISINVSYEDADGNPFQIATEAPTPVMVQSYEDMYGPMDDPGMMDPGMGMDEPMIDPETGKEIIGYDEMGNPIFAEEEGGMPFWAWFAIGGGVLVVVIVVIVIIVKKKKKADDYDDMQYFYAMNNMNQNQNQTQNQNTDAKK